MPTPPKALLPTLEEARSAKLAVRTAPWWKVWAARDLLSEEPLSSRHVAALHLDARILVRSVRTETEDVGPRTAAEMPRAATSADTASGGVSQHLVRLIDQAASACTYCPSSPGRSACTVCGGEGRIQKTESDGSGNSQQVWVSCFGCEGTGALMCTKCDGTGTSLRAEIATVEDGWTNLRYWYFPQLRFSLENELRAILDRVQTWPAELSIPLEEKLATAGYRSAPSRPDEFHGYDIDEAIDRARAMVTSLAADGTLLKATVSATAFPLVHLSYRKAEVLLYTLPGQPIAAAAVPL